MPCNPLTPTLTALGLMLWTPRATLLFVLGLLLLLQPPGLLELLSPAASRPSSGLAFTAARINTPFRTRGAGGHGVAGGLNGDVDNSSDDNGDADTTGGAGDGTSSGDGATGGEARTCSKICYKDMLPGTSGACKAQEYNPGLFQMLTDARTRRAAQSFFGDRTRLRAALKRYHDGANLTVVTVGGSITAGQGAVDAPPFPKWLQFVLDANLPDKDRVKVHNGAVPGTSSQYMSSCHNAHVPREADIIFVEYAVNDEEMPMPHMNNQIRRPYERLLRKLLGYPKRPAVILMHAFRWFQLQMDLSGQFWLSGERQQSEFGLYYGLPQLSVKACCYHYMVEGKKGFQVKRPRANRHGVIQHENFVDATLKDFAFFYDIVHPDGNTGHRVMGEIAAQLVLDVWADVAAGYQLSPEDQQNIDAPLPVPMLPDNLESKADKCFIGPAFQRTMIESGGFEWINEGKAAHLPKWGFVSDVPDTYIKFKINTLSNRTHSDALVTVELGHLRSYENMGRAGVHCEGGCTCNYLILDGHHPSHTSQTFPHPFKVTQAEDCVIAVKVLHETGSGKHKVKITGIMVSEDPLPGAFQDWSSFDWVSIAASKDPNGVFEMGNTGRRALLERNAASSAEIMRGYYEALEQEPASGGNGATNVGDPVMQALNAVDWLDGE
ncbi:hypothetical protein Vafri_14684 [Volvox africanus]|uniref:SGNH hydrolase-type esterase domain-containing protein n=1 Tax=Volvox africanus TaxID=51714 RepID=A0A8J4F4K3_9CHLO|nr:hypothetical protein Vafri_14684 [Volvox africanus]